MDTGLLATCEGSSGQADLESGNSPPPENCGLCRRLRILHNEEALRRHSATMLLPGDKSAEWVKPVRTRRAIVVVDAVESERLIKYYEDFVIDCWRRFVNEVRTEVLPTHFVLPPPGR